MTTEAQKKALRNHAQGREDSRWMRERIAELTRQRDSYRHSANDLATRCARDEERIAAWAAELSRSEARVEQFQDERNRAESLSEKLLSRERELMGQLENCINHLELLKRTALRSTEEKVTACVESANQILAKIDAQESSDES